MARSEKEKKQLIVMGTLIVVLLGVGAFSFLGGGGGAKPAAANTAQKTSKETAVPDANRDYGDKSGTKEEMTGVAGPEYTDRDPFSIPHGLQGLAKNAGPGTAPRPIGGGPAEHSPHTMTAAAAAGVTPVNPQPMAGDVRVDPSASNPGAHLASQAGPEKSTEFVPSPENPGVSLVGVVQGDVPVAILQDHGGKQFFIKLGTTAQDVRLIAVQNRHVVIEYGGKEHVLHLAK